MTPKFLAEFLGTMFLVMVVLGSGIMAMDMFDGHAGLALLANSIATGAGLFVLIQSLGSLSGAHINPIVTFVEVLWQRMPAKEGIIYVLAQCLGACAGILLVHVMFRYPVFQISFVERAGWHLWISEFVASFGLICVVALAGKKHVEFAPLAVAAYVTSAYWFTSSTGFMNPAVTLARTLTNTFGGMAPSYFLPFVVSQFTGAFVAWLVLKKLRS